MKKVNMKTPASFSVIIVDNKVCATTRDDGTIGLPGGLMENSETVIETCLRESEEEGWEINLKRNTQIIPFLTDIVDDRLITWVLFNTDAKAKVDYLEKERGILPILVDIEEIKNSGKGNSFAIELAIKLLNNINNKYGNN
jgi:ADP-ribose pyrophosphatase YjhB (NUDIX family)